MRLRGDPLTDGGLEGIGFASSAERGSQVEAKLSEVQASLAGSGDPKHGKAHLYLFYARDHSERELTLVGLWVPRAQVKLAVARLSSAGFDVLVKEE